MRFNVLAVDARQQVVALNLDAASESLAAEMVQSKGLALLSLKQSGMQVPRFKRAARFATTLFSMELAALLGAGLNLVEALQTLSDKDAHGERRDVLAGLLAAIRRGEPFSQAVAACPRQFSQLYVATIKSAERTGSLKEALGRYIAYQEEIERVRKKIVSATIYPAVLLVIGALVIGFLVLYVVPRFARVYEDMAATLPFFSKVLLGFGSFMGAYGWAMALFFFGLLAFAIFSFSKPEIRAKANRAVWRIPAIGSRMKTYQLARLYRTAGMLMDAGIPALRALGMCRDLLASHLKPQLAMAEKQIEKGIKLSAALAAASLATPVAARMMAVGERSGEMGRMFCEIARFHDDEVARFIDVFTRAFEPILMTILGGAVGLVVVLMYMPIFELAGEHPVNAASKLDLHMPAISGAEMRALAPAFDAVPYAEALRRCCVALRAGTENEAGLSVVLGDPLDLDTQDWLESRLEAPFRYRIAEKAEVAAYLAQQEEKFSALDGISLGVQETAHDKNTQEISFESAAEADSSVVRLVTSTLYDALKAGASDVHLECTAGGLTVKYRIDGVLTTAQSVAGVEFAEQVISRIKVMSELDISERRVPQDGRFKARREGRDIDFRVSVMPSTQGEDAVLRILDRRALSDQLSGLSLESLGFESLLKTKLRELAAQPYGMMLVTGPTGSGKTTTLYALISETNNGEDKFVTIEDPVEYQLPGVLQIPVNEQKGLTFARGLRSILRHDPDRIMVGEIRDPETAEIAVQSALTGHLVYTTVHANNAIDVLGRFRHMGVDAYNLVSALNGVLAQRLVRTFCKSCKGAGCGDCRGTGFKGRKAIGELLVLDDDLRELIVARAPARQLKEAARKAGTLPLREAALQLVQAGETTLEEINRVTFVA